MDLTPVFLSPSRAGGMWSLMISSLLRRGPLSAMFGICLLAVLLGISGLVPGVEVQTGFLQNNVYAAIILCVAFIVCVQIMEKPEKPVLALICRATFVGMFLVALWSTYILLRHGSEFKDYTRSIFTLILVAVGMYQAALASDPPFSLKRLRVTRNPH